MKRTAIWLSVIVGLQLAWMAAVAISKETHLASGRVVWLETAPVDPRDLLRGDYIVLRYKISDIPPTLLNEMPAAGPNASATSFAGRTIYVTLEKRGEYHQAVAATFDPPPRDQSQLVIRGTVAQENWNWRPGALHVRYGIEEYNVREGTGNPRGKVTVKAVLDNQGSALIKEVLVDGKPYSQMTRQR